MVELVLSFYFQPITIKRMKFAAFRFRFRFEFKQCGFLNLIVVHVGLIWIFGLGQDDIENWQGTS
jgi:hypothetical protein